MSRPSPSTEETRFARAARLSSISPSSFSGVGLTRRCRVRFPRRSSPTGRRRAKSREEQGCSGSGGFPIPARSTVPGHGSCHVWNERGRPQGAPLRWAGSAGSVTQERHLSGADSGGERGTESPPSQQGRVRLEVDVIFVSQKKFPLPATGRATCRRNGSNSSPPLPAPPGERPNPVSRVEIQIPQWEPGRCRKGDAGSGSVPDRSR